MTLDLPSDAPPISLSGSTNSASDGGKVVAATTAQIQEFTKYAGIAATAYCRSVVPDHHYLYLLAFRHKWLRLEK
ncbi:hypothetical protein G6F68_021457 [Rhizopus microsporus]|nr:hypothetical protein G6F68_021457 [Rhizopus microsporus]